MERAESAPFHAHVALAAAMAIVGSSVIAGKIMVQDLPVMTAGLIRFAIGTAVMVPIHVAIIGNPLVLLVGLGRRETLALIGQAGFGIFLFSVFLLEGLARTSALEAGIILATLPAAAGILSVLLLGERLGSETRVAILLAVAGLVLIQTAGAANSGGSLVGNLLVLLAVICEALFSVLGKISGGRLPPLTIATAMSALGLLFFLPFGLVDAATVEFRVVSAETWVAVAYTGTLVTAGAFFLWYSGLKHLPASRAGIYTAVMPLSAVLLSALLLGDRIGVLQTAGMALVMVSILLPAWGGKQLMKFWKQ